MPAKSAPIPSTAQKLPSENDREAVPIKTPVRSDVEQRQPATGKTAPKNYGVLPPTADEGLNQAELCNFYGLSSSNVGTRAKGDFEGYFHQKTGIAWRHGETRGMTKIYFPVAE